MNHPELVSFFATHKVAEIQNIDAYTKYCEKNRGIFGFEEARDKTEMAKKAIEERLDRQRNGADQIRVALKLLEAQRHLDFDRYYNLIAAGYKPNWSRDQQNYFEHAVRIVRSGKDFFLSFTSRGPESFGDKRVNRRYWYFIRQMIPLVGKSERKDRNLLADAIDTMLRDSALNGFYYKRHENDNSVVEQKLLDACTSSLVFIQLVDNAMFNVDETKPRNYCKYQYENALTFIRQIQNMVEDRVIFLVTERKPDDLPDPDRVHAPYRGWVVDILSKSAIYLPPVQDNDKRIIDEMKTKVAGLVEQVKAARRNILDRIPN